MLTFVAYRSHVYIADMYTNPRWIFHLSRHLTIPDYDIGHVRAGGGGREVDHLALGSGPLLGLGSATLKMRHVTQALSGIHDLIDRLENATS